jgi:glutamate-1-semialdehyde aminotransferase
MAHNEIKSAIGSPAVTALKRSMQNNGVDIMGRDSFLVSSTHTESEIDKTLAAVEKSLSDVRAEGLL